MVVLVIDLVRHKRRSGGLAPTGTGDEPEVGSEGIEDEPGAAQPASSSPSVRS